MTASLLVDSKLPSAYWSYAARYAATVHALKLWKPIMTGRVFPSCQAALPQLAEGQSPLLRAMCNLDE
jgi:hypothetical protein